MPVDPTESSNSFASWDRCGRMRFAVVLLALQHRVSTTSLLQLHCASSAKGDPRAVEVTPARGGVRKACLSFG